MFPAVVPVLDTLGSGLVSVNYGSNLDGSGGGEPAEAAAWVAYANGSPSNAQAIGKDSKGNDWKTVGFWAGLRASAPLATDDGYNHLRIGHPSPIGIPLWTVGNEPWGNGFYGQARTLGSDADNQGKYMQSPPPEPDLHAGLAPTSKEWGRNQGNDRVGPAAYGAAVVEYVKAMKAVDPTILVGAFVIKPPYRRGGAVWKRLECGVLRPPAAAWFALPRSGRQGARRTGSITWMSEICYSTQGTRESALETTRPGAVVYDYNELGRDLLDKCKVLPQRSPPAPRSYQPGPVWMVARRGPASAVRGRCHHNPARMAHGGVVPIHALSPSFLDNKNQPQPLTTVCPSPGSADRDTFVTARSGKP
jgi:hypothetical protein